MFLSTTLMIGCKKDIPSNETLINQVSSLVENFTLQWCWDYFSMKVHLDFLDFLYCSRQGLRIVVLQLTCPQLSIRLLCLICFLSSTNDHDKFWREKDLFSQNIQYCSLLFDDIFVIYLQVTTCSIWLPNLLLLYNLFTRKSFLMQSIYNGKSMNLLVTDPRSSNFGLFT